MKPPSATGSPSPAPARIGMTASSSDSASTPASTLPVGPVAGRQQERVQQDSPSPHFVASSAFLQVHSRSIPHPHTRRVRSRPRGGKAAPMGSAQGDCGRWCIDSSTDGWSNTVSQQRDVLAGWRECRSVRGASARQSLASSAFPSRSWGSRGNAIATTRSSSGAGRCGGTWSTGTIGSHSLPCPPTHTNRLPRARLASPARVHRPQPPVRPLRETAARGGRLVRRTAVLFHRNQSRPPRRLNHEFRTLGGVVQPRRLNLSITMQLSGLVEFRGLLRHGLSNGLSGWTR